MANCPEIEHCPQPALTVLDLDTAFPGIAAHLIHDFAAVGDPLPINYDHLRYFTPQQQAYMFRQHCIGKRPEDLLEMLDYTTARTTSRLAEWAGLLLKAEWWRGREIGLWSDILPEDAVVACAQGLEDQINLRPQVVRGAVLCVDRPGVYTGRQVNLCKLTLLGELSRDYQLYTLAEKRIKTAMHLFKLVQRPLLVNPEPNLCAGWGLGVDTLYEQPRPSRLSFLAAGRVEPCLFDLNATGGENVFLDALYENWQDIFMRPAETKTQEEAPDESIQ